MTIDYARHALLPAGLRDRLPPEAEQEAIVAGRLIKAFVAQGYQRVAPPLVEFETPLTNASALANQFRVMDPVSQRMMAVRADLTPPIARIATTRLKAEPRPLRLVYAGEVLRVNGTQLQPERQFTQLGVELIGSATIAADVEVVRLAADALRDLGVSELTVDLNSTPMVAALFAHFGIEGEHARELRGALDRKDPVAVAGLAGPAGTALGGLLAATGPAHGAMLILTGLDLPDRAAEQRARLAGIAEALIEAVPDLNLTIDPVESRGFEYHEGVGFTLFARDDRVELGRGGRYTAGVGDLAEPATGFSLTVEALARVVPAATPRRRLFVPHGTGHETARQLRAQGFVTIAGLAPADPITEARRLGCTHLWRSGAVEEL